MTWKDWLLGKKKSDPKPFGRPAIDECGNCGRALRFDGFYQSVHEPDNRELLRFYADGTVLTASTIGTAIPSLVVRWFRRENIKSNRYLSHGRYVVRDNCVSFSSTSEDGTVDYEGNIDGVQLNLSSYSHINGHRASQTYRFIQISGTKIIGAPASLIETILGDNDPAIRKEALIGLIADRRATEVLELTGISILSDDREIRRTALQRLDERGDTARVISLIRSWNREGYLLAMAKQMNAEQRIRAAEIEAAFLAKEPLSSAIPDGPSVPSPGSAQFNIEKKRHSCVAEFCARCQEDHCKCTPCRLTTPEK